MTLRRVGPRRSISSMRCKYLSTNERAVSRPLSRRWRSSARVTSSRSNQLPEENDVAAAPPEAVKARKRRRSSWGPAEEVGLAMPSRITAAPGPGLFLRYENVLARSAVKPPADQDMV